VEETSSGGQDPIWVVAQLMMMMIHTYIRSKKTEAATGPTYTGNPINTLITAYHKKDITYKLITK
jgi:hypothetical protein